MAQSPQYQPRPIPPKPGAAPSHIKQINLSALVGRAAHRSLECFIQHLAQGGVRVDLIHARGWSRSAFRSKVRDEAMSATYPAIVCLLHKIYRILVRIQCGWRWPAHRECYIDNSACGVAGCRRHRPCGTTIIAAGGLHMHQPHGPPYADGTIICMLLDTSRHHGSSAPPLSTTAHLAPAPDTDTHTTNNTNQSSTKLRAAAYRTNVLTTIKIRNRCF